MIPIEEGLRALRAVQAEFPGAILAGGYLRDAMCGKAQKDIDIFVPAPKNESFAIASYTRLGAELMTGAAQYMEQTEVSLVYEMGGYALPVQIIELAPGMDPVDRAKAHDFGICQVWHDGVDLGWTEYFDADRESRTFTLTDCANETEFARSMRRWDRLKVKFPEFTLVVPERFQAFDLNRQLAEALS